LLEGANSIVKLNVGHDEISSSLDPTLSITSGWSRHSARRIQKFG